MTICINNIRCGQKAVCNTITLGGVITITPLPKTTAVHRLAVETWPTRSESAFFTNVALIEEK